MTRRYDWQPAAPDFRNYRYKDISPQRTVVPAVKYLINPAVQNQLSFGSCVFNAVTTAHEAMQIQRQNVVPPVMLSRMFAYYVYRRALGEIKQDNGASIFMALKILSKGDGGTYQGGICREELWPYLPENFGKEPPPECFEDAKNYRLGEYRQLESIDDMVQCVADNFGFVGGISVYSSYEDEKTEETGIISLPQKTEKWLGGHCLYFCGYDLHNQRVQYQQSYGPEWAKQSNYPGHGFIPHQYLADSHLAGEFFTIRG
ncbi:MAG: C1 family peptidase [Desulfobaccales bacterium]